MTSDIRRSRFVNDTHLADKIEEAEMQGRVQFRAGPFMLSGWMWIALVLILGFGLICCCGLVGQSVQRDVERTTEQYP